MNYAFLITLIFMSVGSLVFSILSFMGKDIILDNAYIKASKEDREKMDKKAYRTQSGIVFIFVFLVSLCNLLRFILHIEIFTYIALSLGMIGIIYAIVSHYKLKK